MIINGSMGRTSMFSFGNHRTSQRANTNSDWMNASQRMGENDETGVSAARSAAEKKRMLSRDKEDEQDLTNLSRLLEQSRNYTESLRNARTEKKTTNQKLKKLRYNYKSISSQLLRSKTSLDAAQVARKARRQLVMLKGKRLHESAKYDSYELEAAITHAQAMVRVARKKVKHLQEEELMKVKGGPCAGELEERKEEENQLTDEERDYLENFASGGNGSGTENGAGIGYEAGYGSGNEIGGAVISQEDVLAARQEWAQAYEEVMSQSDIQEEMRMMELQRARESSGSMADAMSELTDEMSDSMQQLLEELAESTATMNVEMDPEDYKMMKLKHRLEEMRAIAEADAKYLKAMFNKYEKAKEASAQAASSANSGNNSVGAGSGSGGMVVAANTGGSVLTQAAATPQPQAIDVVSTPDAVAAVAVEGCSVDVSV